MFGGYGYTGSLGYIIPLCILTGVVILRLDVIGYEIESMKKEKKVARFLGWLNISCGIVLFVGNWIINQWSY